MLNIIDSNLFREMILGATKFLLTKKEEINRLNVFPVPDGDTGTNMSLTIQEAVSEMSSLASNATFNDIARAVSKGSLKGARGNSGVILSQILKGFCQVIADSKEFTTKVFSSALKRGTEIAYSAVTKPKEGTILTVVRVAAESSVKAATKCEDFKVFLHKVLEKAEATLLETPDMLPVLKKAGVVDSGGMGLVCILRGFYNVICDIEIPDVDVEGKVSTLETLPHMPMDIHDLESVEFYYCTEFFISNLNPKTTESDIDKFRDKLMTFGDSVIVIGDLYLVKVHIHTNSPDKALSLALKIGELNKIKIDNMMVQRRELIEKYHDESKKLGIIATSFGAGINKMFLDCGVDKIVEGGQTMNPSVSDFLSAISTINTQNVIILPNNKNVVLAAENSKELAKKNVFVVPTRNIPQGIAALMAFSPELEIEENIQAMTQATKKVKYGEITHAARSSKMNGFKINVGDIIGMTESGIVAKDSHQNIFAVLKRVLEKLINENVDVITLIYGDMVSTETAAEAADNLREVFPDLEVVTASGGQPHYYYYVSVD